MSFLILTLQTFKKLEAKLLHIVFYHERRHGQKIRGNCHPGRVYSSVKEFIRSKFSSGKWKYSLHIYKCTNDQLFYVLNYF